MASRNATRCEICLYKLKTGQSYAKNQRTGGLAHTACVEKKGNQVIMPEAPIAEVQRPGEEIVHTARRVVSDSKLAAELCGELSRFAGETGQKSEGAADTLHRLLLELSKFRETSTPAKAAPVLAEAVEPEPLPHVAEALADISSHVVPAGDAEKAPDSVDA